MDHNQGEQKQLFDFLEISIASDDVIRNQWSRGEVKKPETINYRTFKPEKGGLFCEKIFGPVKDWECACGKYKKVKHKGIICDRCGVEVTLSKVRRERMAHIELAVPVVHIWLFKTQPSRIGNILGMTLADLERVVYYEENIVVDSGKTNLEKKQLLNDIELREAKEKWGPDSFKVMIGAEAIKELLITEDLDQSVAELTEKLKKTKSIQGRIKISKRLKILEDFSKSSNSPASMVLENVPIIPPDLRPLVPLDGGRFATSDLNDLYRRVINRNNRLKAIMRLKTPDVIIRNEKRMLQESVDALFDNGRHGHPVIGSGNRPLKSISEMLKGKQGRFRQNLLGKRVDYSGRSVIVAGPELKLNQCGLPKKMALDLFEPFIVKLLKERGFVYTIRSAKKMIADEEPIVWDVLEEVTKGHPIILNRAPTLHRLGLQAFEPKLIEGKAIRIHPLVCTAFNADFDGDAMAVHVPLSVESQLEAKLLMMAPDNIFLPSTGKAAAVPTKDMILGIYYLTQNPIVIREDFGLVTKVFTDQNEVFQALDSQLKANWFDAKQSPEDQKIIMSRGLLMNELIKIRVANSIIETTPGRVIFNQIVPNEMGFQNTPMSQKKMQHLINQVYKKVGLEKTVVFLDDLKRLGFREATFSGISMGLRDVVIPNEKENTLQDASNKANEVMTQYEDGVITEGEKHSKIISIWSNVTEKLSEVVYSRISEVMHNRANPLYLMIASGARGNKTQLRQLGALRGLMAKPSGEIILEPIKSNFREGLSVLEFFISSHGARKGLADTALKTADSGYLTRRLVDVSQDVLINEEDCGTLNGIEVSAIKQGNEEILKLSDRIEGRTLCDDIYMPGDKNVLLAKAGTTLTASQAESIEDAGIETVKIRSPLTCETGRGICAKCYGNNLANGRLVSLGEAAGIIAAQSIGEPGTQLTMRTFHIGGVAASAGEEGEAIAAETGVVVYHNIRTVKNNKQVTLALNKNGYIHLVENTGKTVEEYRKLITENSINPISSIPIELGTQILVEDGAVAKKGEKLVIFEQHNYPIISEKSGYVRYEDLVEGISTQKSTNEQTGKTEITVKHHRGELHPQIAIYEDKEFTNLLGTYALPSGAVISCTEEEHIDAGSQLARLPKGAVKTKDITGGLPRVAELFEARKPKDAAEIAKLDGVVDFKGVQKNKRIVIVHDELSGMEVEHLIPLSKHMIVQRGDLVEKGEPLTEGLVVPQEILEVSGVRELQRYLVNQVQEVYRLQGVDINDKHIEIIVKQMLQKVRIVDPGDTTFLYGEDIDRKVFHEKNKIAVEEGSNPAKAMPVLLGITKAALGTESLISAASFQETTRVLTDAACAVRRDSLLDFKSNIITGQKIPSGTGWRDYKDRLNRSFAEAKEIPLEFDFASEVEV